MKRKIGEIYNKPIVIGDKNLVTKNEVHETTLNSAGLNLNPDHDYLLYFTGDSSSKYSYGITDLQTANSTSIISDRETRKFEDGKLITYTIEECVGGIGGAYNVECITVKYNGKHNDPRLEVYYIPGSKYWCNDDKNYVKNHHEIVNMYNLNSTFYRMLKD